MQLDYSLSTSEQRMELVNQIIEETPQEQLNSQYLQYLTNYILFVYDKGQTKKEKKCKDGGVLTKNRMATIEKREMSFEGLVSSLENGEDGVYNLMINDKNQLLDRKSKITEEDMREIPILQQYHDTIKQCEEKLKKAKGKDRYTLKKQIIETWQAMYTIKASHYGIPMKTGASKNQIKTIAHMTIDENITIDENGMPISDNTISLLNPDCVSILLCYYSQLKEESIDDFQSDLRFMLMDLEDAAEKALKNEPVLFDLLIWKIDGRTNEEIIKLMESTYGINHTEQYYSSVWRKQIPKLIVEQVQKDLLNWYYSTQEYGQWKQCGRCGEIKLAHPMFFSKNTSKDGFYSICKECRKEKSKKS